MQGLKALMITADAVDFSLNVTFIQARKGPGTVQVAMAVSRQEMVSITAYRGNEVRKGGKGSEREMSCSCLLRSTAAGGTTSRAAAAAWLETTTRTLATHASTTTRSPAAESSTVELLGTGTTLFDLEVNAIDIVGVGGDGGLVGGRGLEVNEGAVLHIISAYFV
jgi:hypothetical protein